MGSEPTWQAGKPPNEVFVEAQERYEGQPTRVVKAVHGRDGERPHWVDRDGVKYHPDTFTFWRPL